MRRHVERALRLQEQQAPPAPLRRRCRPASACSSGRARRTPAPSTSATAWRRSSRSRATTTPARSSPSRAPRPASGASCGTSSPWAPARWRSSTRCASAPRTTPTGATATATSWRASSAGSADYGNCIGVPNVGGEVVFGRSYSENPLVNAMCVGHRPRRAASSRPGPRGRATASCWSGADTGRDGLHGATFASVDDPAGLPPRRRPGRRPLPGEAADRGLPGGAGGALAGGDAGPGRRRVDVFHGGVRQQGGQRDRDRRRPRLPPGDGDDPLRGDALARARSGCWWWCGGGARPRRRPSSTAGGCTRTSSGR